MQVFYSLINQYSVFYNKYFYIINIYKYSFSQPTNLVNNNLFITLKYKLIKYLNQNLFLSNKKKVFTTINPYYNTIKSVSTFFHKTKLNSIIFFQIYTLLSHYYNYLNITKLVIPNVILPQNTHLSLFLNLFYLKVRNY